MSATLSHSCDILSNITTDNSSTTYEYKFSTELKNTVGGLSPVMGQPNITIAGSSSSTRYTVSGYFKYIVYGII